jgi:hypothetical protein
MQSNEVRFHNALIALDRTGKRKKFEEKVNNAMSIETRLNVAEIILKETGVNTSNLDEFLESTKHEGELESLKEREYQAYRAGGMSEAEARYMVSLAGKER